MKLLRLEKKQERMATVKQVLAAISQDGTLGPNQKRFVTEAIQRAEIWCNLQAGPKPRKVSNAKNLMSIEDWEANDGWPKAAHSMSDWIDRNKLCPRMVSEMVDEFRREMRAKGKQYANFAMAFQTYLRKGYLSKPLTACTLERSTFHQGTVIHNKGVSL